MTTNETIARWRQDGDLPCTGAGLDEGIIYKFSGCLMRCAHNDEGEAVLNDWEPDANILCWHGDDGLLAEILERDILLWGRFCETLVCDEGCPVDAPRLSILTLGLTRTPAQLAAALVEPIGEK